MVKRKKIKPLKCFVLIVSRNFPSTHPKAGLPTHFLDQISNGFKKHTIRQNYELWKKRIDMVNDGLAYISLRYWDGKPYVDSQKEYKTFFRGQIGIEKLEFDAMLGVFIESLDSDTTTTTLATNDGLSLNEFKHWFKPVKFDSAYAIIHFTDFRYSEA